MYSSHLRKTAFLSSLVTGTMFATRILFVSLPALAALALSAVAVPQRLTSRYGVDNVSQDADLSHYHCIKRVSDTRYLMRASDVAVVDTCILLKGVNCIHIVGNAKSASVHGIDSAKAKCTQQFEEPNSGKFAGPIGYGGKCQATTKGTFVVECVATKGAAYVNVLFGNGWTSFVSEGEVTAKLKSASFREETGFINQGKMQHGGVDIFVKCPQ